MIPSPQVVPVPPPVPPPVPLEVDMPELVLVPHWHMPKLLPSAPQDWTPGVPPRHAHSWVVPGTQLGAPVLVVSPPFDPPHAATSATRAPATHTSLDVTTMTSSSQGSPPAFSIWPRIFP